MSAAPKAKENLNFDVEVVAGPHAGMKISFSKASVSIGRGPENDIVLSNDPRASRQHAEIKLRGSSELVVINLSAKNFVLVNGQSVQSEILLKDSVIQIGESEIRVHYAAPTVEVPSVVAPVPTPVAKASEPTPIRSPLAPLGGPAFQTPVVQTPPTPPVGAGAPPYHGGAFPAAAPLGGMPPAAPMGYGAHPMGMPGPVPTSAAPRGQGPLANPRVRFYGVIAILGLVAWWLFSSDNKIKKDHNEIRTSIVSLQDVAEAEKRNQELLTIKKEKYDSVQYRRAQENFIKGFRDFQQGQYARARESFQVVLNLDPDNELAQRYFHLSKIKFDELVKFNMIQGNRYREKRNWRMCQSNYSNVMTMLYNRKDDPTYKEAKQFYDECTLNLEGRF